MKKKNLNTVEILSINLHLQGPLPSWEPQLRGGQCRKSPVFPAFALPFHHDQTHVSQLFLSSTIPPRGSTSLLVHPYTFPFNSALMPSLNKIILITWSLHPFNPSTVHPLWGQEHTESLIHTSNTLPIPSWQTMYSSHIAPSYYLNSWLLCYIRCPCLWWICKS